MPDIEMTLDEMYEVMEEVKQKAEDLTTMICDMKAIRLDDEMQKLATAVEDVWYNAWKMRNKLKKELN